MKLESRLINLNKKRYTMKNILLLLVVLGIVSSITGCSQQSMITKADETKSHYIGAVYQPELNYKSEETTDNTKYRVYHQAASGFMKKQTVLNSVYASINAFCANKDKKVFILEEYTVSGIGLGKFPSAEIIFACIDNLEVKNTVNKYEELSKIKVLLDNGTLTQKEFELEKKKILK